MLSKIELVDYTDILNNGIKVEKTTLDHYLMLKEFLHKKNIEIGIESSYRSIEEQQQTIDYYVEHYGTSYMKKYVAPLYASEHHTGLAIDIAIKINGEYKTELHGLKEQEEILSEIHKYLKDFGFILRYPKDKESITGYNYEAWHIRYVGKVISKIIYDNNLCLEEYLQNFGRILVVNKPKGITSFDVIRKVSKLLGIKKIGHTGTLDPLATGVLVLTIGTYTKLSELLTALNKEYIATAKLNILTDTLDSDGKIIKEDVKEISKDSLINALNHFKGTYLQEVPEYSAVKISGKKLYEYARKKQEIELPKREVTIESIELLDYSGDTFSFKTSVSKGTYIRSLIRDIGEFLGSCATMTELIRTRQGNFKIEDAYSIENIENLEFKLLTIEDYLDIPVVEVQEEEFKKIKNGVQLDNIYGVKDKVIFKYNNEIIAIYKKINNLLKVDKMLYKM